MARVVLPGRMAMRWLDIDDEPAVLATPTVAELGAGVNLIGASQGEGLYEMEGFVRESNVIDTPDYASLNVGNIGGDQTYPASRLAFYYDDTVQTIYTTLTESPAAVGYLAVMFDGLVATEECLLFPATVLSRVRRPDRNFAHVFDVNFSIEAAIQATVTA